MVAVQFSLVVVGELFEAGNLLGTDAVFRVDHRAIVNVFLNFDVAGAKRFIFIRRLNHLHGEARGHYYQVRYVQAVNFL